MKVENLILVEPNMDLFIDAIKAEAQGNKEIAMETYSRIIESDPQHTGALINLGTLRYRLGEYNRAEQLYRWATESAPEYPLSFYNLGNVLDDLSRPDESMSSYLRALELDPNFADAHYNIARAFELRGDLSSALAHWEAYVRLDDNSHWSRHAQIRIDLLSAGKGSPTR